MRTGNGMYKHKAVGARRALVALGATTFAAGTSAGCIDRPVETLEPKRTSFVMENLSLSTVSKIDLLLAIDDSGSMADKQEILALAVPHLVERLANPRCVDAAGQPILEQPTDVLDRCPTGTAREFQAVYDIHIGVIASDMGSQGSSACDGAPSSGNALLVTNGDVATYDGLGFLAWDPNGQKSPPGSTVLGGEGGLVDDLRDLVVGVGQDGCGYEAQLESWYRFLIDPEPYELIGVSKDTGELAVQGIDGTVLQQREDFLRPDSLVAILQLTDENDCSLTTTGKAYRLFNDERLAAPRSECAVDPSDPCCLPCDADLVGTACAPDPACHDSEGSVRYLTEEEDRTEIRCMDPKRRFGLDVLQPVERYVDGLSEVEVRTRSGELKPNPLFAPGEAGVARSRDLVFYGGIVGVPWQDIARDPSSLLAGLQTIDELSQVRPDLGITGWDVILGDPEHGVLPADPLMVQSVDVRTGLHPITGEPVGLPSDPLDTNQITGHDRLIPLRNDLQYACTFPIDARDCEGSAEACDCKVAASTTPEDYQSPLCQEADGSFSQVQRRAKAYPSLRPLSVLRGLGERGLGEQGVVGSVCPSNLDDDQRDDFGYLPVIESVVERLKSKIGGQCLPRSLDPDESGQVACIVVEASVAGKDGGACSCDGVRSPVSDDHRGAIAAIESSEAGMAVGWDCFCELPQLRGEELDVCQTDVSVAPTSGGSPVDGWCYVDATSVPQVGDPALVDACPENQKRQVRLVGDAALRPGATTFVMCAGG